MGQHLVDITLSRAPFPVNVVTEHSFANPDVLKPAIAEYNNRPTGIFTDRGGDILTFEKPYNGSPPPATRKAESGETVPGLIGNCLGAVRTRSGSASEEVADV